MIISHKHRFIFIRTRRTAGTSLEIVLSRYCGPKDVITPLPTEDELIRRDLDVYPCNHARWPMSLAVGGLFNMHRMSLSSSRFAARFGPQRFTPFMPARQIARLVGQDVWNSYFKFAVERDPLDRLISGYYAELREDRVRTIDEFFSRPALQSNFDLYSIDGQVAVDHVIRFDQLAEDFSRVCDAIGIVRDTWLPRAKAGNRRNKRGWRELLDPEQIDRVRQELADEYRVLRDYGAPIPPEIWAPPGEVLPMMTGGDGAAGQDGMAGGADDAAPLPLSADQIIDEVMGSASFGGQPGHAGQVGQGQELETAAVLDHGADLPKPDLGSPVVPEFHELHQLQETVIKEQPFQEYRVQAAEPSVDALIMPEIFARAFPVGDVPAPEGADQGRSESERLDYAGPDFEALSDLSQGAAADDEAQTERAGVDDDTWKRSQAPLPETAAKFSEHGIREVLEAASGQAAGYGWDGDADGASSNEEMGRTDTGFIEDGAGVRMVPQDDARFSERGIRAVLDPTQAAPDEDLQTENAASEDVHAPDLQSGNLKTEGWQSEDWQTEDLRTEDLDAGKMHGSAAVDQGAFGGQPAAEPSVEADKHAEDLTAPEPGIAADEQVKPVTAETADHDAGESKDTDGEEDDQKAADREAADLEMSDREAGGREVNDSEVDSPEVDSREVGGETGPVPDEPAAHESDDGLEKPLEPVLEDQAGMTRWEDEENSLRALVADQDTPAQRRHGGRRIRGTSLRGTGSKSGVADLSSVTSDLDSRSAYDPQENASYKSGSRKKTADVGKESDTVNSLVDVLAEIKADLGDQQQVRAAPDRDGTENDEEKLEETGMDDMAQSGSGYRREMGDHPASRHLTARARALAAMLEDAALPDRDEDDEDEQDALEAEARGDEARGDEARDDEARDYEDGDEGQWGGRPAPDDGLDAAALLESLRLIRTSEKRRTSGKSAKRSRSGDKSGEQSQRRVRAPSRRRARLRRAVDEAPDALSPAPVTAAPSAQDLPHDQTGMERDGAGGNSFGQQVDAPWTPPAPGEATPVTPDAGAFRMPGQDIFGAPASSASQGTAAGQNTGSQDTLAPEPEANPYAGPYAGANPFAPSVSGEYEQVTPVTEAPVIAEPSETGFPHEAAHTPETASPSSFNPAPVNAEPVNSGPVNPAPVNPAPINMVSTPEAGAPADHQPAFGQQPADPYADGSGAADHAPAAYAPADDAPVHEALADNYEDVTAAPVPPAAGPQTAPAHEPAADLEPAAPAPSAVAETPAPVAPVQVPSGDGPASGDPAAPGAGQDRRESAPSQDRSMEGAWPRAQAGTVIKPRSTRREVMPSSAEATRPAPSPSVMKAIGADEAFQARLKGEIERSLKKALGGMLGSAVAGKQEEGTQVQDATASAKAPDVSHTGGDQTVPPAAAVVSPDPAPQAEAQVQTRNENREDADTPTDLTTEDPSPRPAPRAQILPPRPVEEPAAQTVTQEPVAPATPQIPAQDETGPAQNEVAVREESPQAVMAPSQSGVENTVEPARPQETAPAEIPAETPIPQAPVQVQADTDISPAPAEAAANTPAANTPAAGTPPAGAPSQVEVPNLVTPPQEGIVTSPAQPLVFGGEVFEESPEPEQSLSPPEWLFDEYLPWPPGADDSEGSVRETLPPPAAAPITDPQPPVFAPSAAQATGSQAPSGVNGAAQSPAPVVQTVAPVNAPQQGAGKTDTSPSRPVSPAPVAPQVSAAATAPQAPTPAQAAPVTTAPVAPAPLTSAPANTGPATPPRVQAAPAAPSSVTPAQAAPVPAQGQRGRPVQEVAEAGTPAAPATAQAPTPQRPDPQAAPVQNGAAPSAAQSAPVAEQRTVAGSGQSQTAPHGQGPYVSGWAFFQPTRSRTSPSGQSGSVARR